MMKRGMAILAGMLWASAVVGAEAGFVLHSFERIQMTDAYYAEGAGYGDFNRDGAKDVVMHLDGRL